MTAPDHAGPANRPQEGHEGRGIGLVNKLLADRSPHLVGDDVLLE